MAGSDDSLTVISANRLDSGAVVWFGPGACWIDRLTDAEVFAPADVAAALAAAQRDERAHVVVDPYTIEVALEAGRPRPLRPRERIRGLGPSVRPDLGYQARPSL